MKTESIPTIDYEEIANVIHCWEYTKKKYSCRETIGKTILLNMFTLEPSTKLVFGFQLHHKNIDQHPMLRAGLMVHGLRIVHMIDQILDLLGPDMETLMEILQDVGKRHEKFGVQKEHYTHLGTAIRHTMKHIMKDEQYYTSSIDNAWTHIFDILSSIIVQG